MRPSLPCSPRRGPLDHHGSLQISIRLTQHADALLDRAYGTSGITQYQTGPVWLLAVPRQWLHLYTSIKRRSRKIDICAAGLEGDHEMQAGRGAMDLCLWHAMRLRPEHWAAIGYLALLVTAVAFVCWYTSVAIIGPGRAGLLTGVAPLAAALAGAVTMGQLPTAPVWLGIGVVCAGLVVGLGPQSRSAVRVAGGRRDEEARRLSPAAPVIVTDE